MALKRAVRAKMKVPIMLMGASGSGKTVSALLIAKGIVREMFPDLSNDERWEKIAVIDTEHSRSTLYAGMTINEQEIGSFLHYDLTAPFTPQRYKEAFMECKKAGCEVVIVDSITHAWSGEGGILDKVNSLGGKFSDWNKVKPDENILMSMFLDTDVHVIACVRSKQGYELTTLETGKLQIEKVGLKAEQKDSLEYEFAITFQLYQNHTAEAMKDNSNSFDGRFIITEQTGKQIYDWAEEGIDIKAMERKKKAETISQIKELADLSEEHQKLLDDIRFKMNGIELEEFEQVALNKALKLLEGVDNE
ncbi:hypothetical protein CYJ57_03170 [Falseniella ignava]|uniref:AAA+ ATPase domain-containing protein n=1 Tax=Falseniella ignava TaxID=137730 RepID=A0A2I1K2F4_9LACT|nr:AAA family ATPase [Falseniella ignava]PKY89722.1 hypothetical protein CYJ57_03170 [Falseniella ignava]